MLYYVLMRSQVCGNNFNRVNLGSIRVMIDQPQGVICSNSCRDGSCFVTGYVGTCVHIHICRRIINRSKQALRNYMKDERWARATKEIDV